MFEISDGRAFWYGTLGSAILLAVLEFVAGVMNGFSGATGTMGVVAGSCILAGVPAGLIVGMTNRKKESPFSEAGIAGLLGTVVSIPIYLGLLVVIGQQSLSQVQTIAMFVFILTAPVLVLIGPLTYAVAGFISTSIVGGETQFGSTGARGLK